MAIVANFYKKITTFVRLIEIDIFYYFLLFFYD